MIGFIILCVVVALAVLCITNRIGDTNYVHKVILYLDVFACAVLTRNPDMTLSARCGLYCRHDPPASWYVLGKLLEVLQRGHLEMSIKADLERAQAAVKMLAGELAGELFHEFQIGDRV